MDVDSGNTEVRVGGIKIKGKDDGKTEHARPHQERVDEKTPSFPMPEPDTLDLDAMKKRDQEFNDIARKTLAPVSEKIVQDIQDKKSQRDAQALFPEQDSQSLRDLNTAITLEEERRARSNLPGQQEIQEQKSEIDAGRPAIESGLGSKH